MDGRKQLSVINAGTGLIITLAIISLFATGCSAPGYVGTDTCLACHNGKQAPDRRDFLGSPHEAVGCEACHGPGVFHARIGGRFGLFINDAEEVASLCVRCHEEETTEFNQSGHAQMGILKCTDCHNPHTKAVTVRSFTDNQLCLQCHAYNGFETEEIITNHTWHSYDPEGTGESQCVLCHMTPTTRINQDSNRSHTLIPVPPINSNLAGTTPAPPNSCAGVVGCHDGTVTTAPVFDVDDPETNEWLQTLYDSRYGS